jgi:hypothetical protein
MAIGNDIRYTNPPTVSAPTGEAPVGQPVWLGQLPGADVPGPGQPAPTVSAVSVTSGGGGGSGVYSQPPSGINPGGSEQAVPGGLYPVSSLPSAQVNSQGISPGKVLATPGGHLRTGGPNPGFTNLGSLAGLYQERGRIY